VIPGSGPLRRPGSLPLVSRSAALRTGLAAGVRLSEGGSAFPRGNGVGTWERRTSRSATLVRSVCCRCFSSGSWFDRRLAAGVTVFSKWKETGHAGPHSVASGKLKTYNDLPVRRPAGAWSGCDLIVPLQGDVPSRSRTGVASGPDGAGAPGSTACDGALGPLPGVRPRQERTAAHRRRPLSRRARAPRCGPRWPATMPRPDADPETEDPTPRIPAGSGGWPVDWVLNAG
jgi:hypothetical protein